MVTIWSLLMHFFLRVGQLSRPFGTSSLRFCLSFLIIYCLMQYYVPDSVAAHCCVKEVVRVSGTTSSILKDVLELLPLDEYDPLPVAVMDRCQGDKDNNLQVNAYASIAAATNMQIEELHFVERFEFYEYAKKSFVVIQTDDASKYANVIVRRGVM